MPISARPQDSRLADVRGLDAARLPSPAAFVACTAALVIAAARQGSCFESGTNASCRSDIRVLYGLRGLASHAFPYVHPGQFGLPHGTVEYPMLTGLFVWACGLPITNAQAFMVLSVVVLGAVALLTTGKLYRRFGARCLIFAAAPTLALSAFQNWDLLAVAATVGGLLAYVRRRPGEAAAWFAVGACLKVYPALFLVVLLAEHQRLGWRTLARIAAPAVAVAGAVATPFLLLSPAGLAQVVSFQDSRPADISAASLWAAFGWRLPLGLVNIGALLGAACGARGHTLAGLPGARSHRDLSVRAGLRCVDARAIPDSQGQFAPVLPVDAAVLRVSPVAPNMVVDLRGDRCLLQPGVVRSAGVAPELSRRVRQPGVDGGHRDPVHTARGRRRRVLAQFIDANP